jgi:GNAT superfamily N-acetyltransferase
MSQIILQKANTNNLIDLQKISLETFTSTYSSLNSEENMQLYVSESLSEEKIMTELLSSTTSFYLAYKEDCLIGYFKLNFPEGESILSEIRSMEVERIYLQETYQGKGYGKKLFESIIEIARTEKMNRIWLGVWSKNTNALQFYRKMGFVKFDEHLFKLGEDEQLDYLLELNI